MAQTYTKEKIIESFKNKVHEIYSKPFTTAMKLTPDIIKNHPLIPKEAKDVIERIYADQDALSQQDVLTLENAIDMLKKGHADNSSINLLLKARKILLNKTFILDNESYLKLEVINATLTDLSKKIVLKMKNIYEQWLNSEEPQWRNDCQIKGCIYAESQESSIMERYDYHFYELEFSGNPNKAFPSYLLEPETNRLSFSHWYANSFGDFVCCSAFEYLLSDSCYAILDILKIETFWAEASIEHQRIVSWDNKYN